jgi:hypothetical protein
MDVNKEIGHVPKNDPKIAMLIWNKQRSLAIKLGICPGNLCKCGGGGGWVYSCGILWKGHRHFRPKNLKIGLKDVPFIYLQVDGDTTEFWQFLNRFADFKKIFMKRDTRHKLGYLKNHNKATLCNPVG